MTDRQKIVLLIIVMLGILFGLKCAQVFPQTPHYPGTAKEVCLAQGMDYDAHLKPLPGCVMRKKVSLLSLGHLSPVCCSRDATWLCDKEQQKAYPCPALNTHEAVHEARDPGEERWYENAPEPSLKSCTGLKTAREICDCQGWPWDIAHDRCFPWPKDWGDTGMSWDSYIAAPKAQNSDITLTDSLIVACPPTCTQSQPCVHDDGLNCVAAPLPDLCPGGKLGKDRRCHVMLACPAGAVAKPRLSKGRWTLDCAWQPKGKTR